MKSSSATDALKQTYDDHQRSLDDYEARLPAPENYQGAVFAIGGEVAGLDLFDKPATLAKLWPKLVRGYAIDALEDVKGTAGKAEAPAVSMWLKSFESASAESFKSLGLGDDVRFESHQVVGAGLVIENHPVHVELYPNDER